jgi:hypothetical protein
MSDIVVTTEQMYQLLVKIDRTVTALQSAHNSQSQVIQDHEARIRAIEAEEDLSRRLAVIEGHVAELQRKVWAIPSAATVIALAALVITFTRA